MIQAIRRVLWLVGYLARVTLRELGFTQAMEIANDYCLPTMRKDPMFLWRPADDVVRRESYSYSSDHLAGNDQSSIHIEWTFRTSGDSAALLAEATQAAQDAGYLDGRHDAGRFYIRCVIFQSRDGTGKPSGKGVVIALRAPA